MNWDAVGKKTMVFFRILFTVPALVFVVIGFLYFVVSLLLSTLLMVPFIVLWDIDIKTVRTSVRSGSKEG